MGWCIRAVLAHVRCCGRMKRESSVARPSAEDQLVASGGYSMCRSDVLTGVCVADYEESPRGLRAAFAHCRDTS